MRPEVHTASLCGDEAAAVPAVAMQAGRQASITRASDFSREAETDHQN